MSKYVTSRKYVMVGTLLRIDYSNKLPDRLRGILFNIDSNGEANDLIYNTALNYNINGYDGFCINDYVELNDLLKYLKYDDDLTQKDLLKIYKKLLLSRVWLDKHMDLFGWVKLDDKLYCNGGKEIIPMKIYKCLNDIHNLNMVEPRSVEPCYTFMHLKK